MARKQSETMKKLASFESAMSIVRVKLRSDGMPVHVSSNGSGCLVVHATHNPNVPRHRNAGPRLVGWQFLCRREAIQA